MTKHHFREFLLDSMKLLMSRNLPHRYSCQACAGLTVALESGSRKKKTGELI